MDRDDHPSALTTTTSTALTLRAVEVRFEEAFPRLPAEVKLTVAAKNALMQRIAKARKVMPECKAISRENAGRRGYSADTLSDDFYLWKQIGPAALIDHRKCKGCGTVGCSNADRKGMLPKAVVDAWLKSALQVTDKRVLSESWKKIIRKLCAGEAIEGAGTWREVYAAAFPFRHPPAACPWSLHRPPPGWSLSNFMRHKPAKVVQQLAQRGSFAAWDELPQVRLDLTTLRPFEWLVVDDHRLDFLCYVPGPNGKLQLVELWGLFVMDVATRMIVSFGLKPRIVREDGSVMAFEHRDMQHLIANVLGTYGIPADYDQTWIVENASAAVSTDAERLLSFVTGGRVKIKRSGIQVGDYTLSGFPERWGNYRGKRWIEVWFAALDIVLGGVKGQMGSDYWSKPGSFDARKAFGNRLLKLLDKCTPETRAKLALPFEWSGDAHWLVSDAIELLNHRTDHDLDGFEKVRFFAYEPHSTMIPMHPKLALLHGVESHLETFSKVPQELREVWLGYGGAPRCISPAEKMAMEKGRMVQLAPETLADLYFDEVSRWKGGKLLYRGGDVLDIEVKQGSRSRIVRLCGNLPGIEQGQPVIARLNADHVECGAWIFTEDRRFIAHLTHGGTPTHDDIDGLHKMLGAQIKALKQAQKSAEAITTRPQDARQRIGELAQLTETFHTVRDAERQAKEPETLPAPDASRELVQQVGTLKPRDGQPVTRQTLRELRKARARVNEE